MNRLIELEPGRQIVISSDDRTEGIWLQLCANKGMLGVKLSAKEALQLRRALFEAVYPKRSE